jgi:hypothetical protein
MNPEEEPGEYGKKFEEGLTKIPIGYLVRLAKKHGYEPESSNVEIPNDIFPLSSGRGRHSRAAEAMSSEKATTVTAEGPSLHRAMFRKPCPLRSQSSFSKAC